jgi:hypothetical protein
MKKHKIGLVMVLFFIIAAFYTVGCKNEAPADYFPIGVGSYWEYIAYTTYSTGISQISKDVYVVGGQEMIDDQECYRIDYFTIQGNTPSVANYREFLAKTKDGVFCSKRSFPLLKAVTIDWELRNNPGEPRYKNAMKEGDAWKWDGYVTLQPQKNPNPSATPNPNEVPKFEQIKGKFEYEYKGKESLTVLNKKMDCIKIYIHATSDDKQEYDRFVWYAPGVGKVREETTFYKGSDVIKTLLELSNYNITNREMFKKK